MIIDISSEEFKRVFANKNLFLPIRWDGRDFVSTLQKLYSDYTDLLFRFCPKEIAEKVRRCCSLIIDSIDHYLYGFPAEAYRVFECLMHQLMEQPLQRYNKSIFESIMGTYNDPLGLFRIVER